MDKQDLFDCVALCHFDAEKDISEVDQFGFVNLHEVWESGTVPANLQTQEGNFNNIEDPSMLKARPSDVFEAINAQKHYAQIVRDHRESATSDGEN